MNMERPFGQASMTDAIKGFAIAIVAIVVIGFAVSSIRESTIEERTGTTYTNELLNTSFTENTGLNADHWDNYVENGATASLDTSQDYFLMRTTENENTSTPKIDNGVLKQSVTVSTIHDELVSATSTFSFRVYDNDNARSIVVKVLLDDGTDNTTLYSENVTLKENTSWTTVENDVISYVTTAGTYTLWIRAEMLGYASGSGAGTLCEVQFDNVNLTVDTYDRSVGEDIAHDTGSPTVKVFTLMFVTIVIGAALYLLRRFEVL